MHLTFTQWGMRGILFIVFICLEWVAVSRSAGVLLQRRAVFFARSTNDFSSNIGAALRADPDNGITRLYLAGFFMAKGDYVRARQETVCALKTCASIAAYNQLGSIALSGGDILGAKEYFARVVRLYPDDNDARLRLVAVNLSQNDTASARKNIEQLLLSHPENVNGYYFLGILETMEHHPAAALGNFRKVERLTTGASIKLLFTPDNLYYQMALTEFALKDLKEAEGHLKKALALKSDVSYVYLLSRLYVTQKQFEKAKNLLLNGLRTHPGDGKLKAALSALEKITSPSQERKK